MIGRDFEYNKKRLSDFGLIMANPDNEDTTGLSRDIIKGNVTIYRNEANHYGTIYNSVIVLNFFIVKDNCHTEDHEITPLELRHLQSWLTSSKLPQDLYVVGDTGERIEYFGIFTDITPYVCNGLNGLKLVFTCNSPFAYKTYNLKLKLSDITEGIQKTIFCDCDEIGQIIYPTITFIPNGTDDLTMISKTENKIMTLKFSKQYEKIIIDCKMKRIIADDIPLTLSDIGYKIEEISDYNNVNTGIFNMYWFRLLDKKNELIFKGNGTLYIKYEIPEKLGGVNCGV